MNARIGSLAGDIAELGTAGRPRDALGWTLQIGGLLVCAALAYLLVRRATRAVDRALARERDASREHPHPGAVLPDAMADPSSGASLGRDDGSARSD